MNLLSINVSKPIEVDYQGKKVSTGIYKKPVDAPVFVTKLGIESDGQADLESHGGLDKAIYAYSVENYRYWEETLQRPEMAFGQFGENLTVENMPDDRIHIGDIFEIGKVRIQVTQPRVPCFKLGIKMEMPTFPKQFMRSGRAGFYMRVLEEGEIDQGNTIRLIRQDPATLTIEQAMLAMLKGPMQLKVIKKALTIEALSKAWKDDLSKRLENRPETT